jgi:hypothetical protein
MGLEFAEKWGCPTTNSGDMSQQELGIIKGRNVDG